MRKSLRELSDLIGGKLIGDGSVIITGAGDIETATEGCLSFIKDKSYFERAKNSHACAFIVPVGFTGLSVPIIEVENPYLAFTKILNLIAVERRGFYKGVHPTVVLGRDVKLQGNVSIGPYSVLGDYVSIGANTVICSNCFIGDRTTIGENTFIYPNVSIREDTEIGKGVRIDCGTVIGSDGHGYIPQGEGYVKIPQIGKVVIEDNVDIGSNVSIDRATLNKTVIGRGTKIDNLVHIAHNVTIGENSMLLAHVTIAGSTKIGKHAIFSGQSGTIDNLKVGDNVVAAARTGILNDVPDNSVIWGMPAKPIVDEKKIVLLLKNLPELVRELKNLKQKIAELIKK
ncbi:MAG: UDP-3-O-(3-hydroxymyristoyl)glucosamine N-acyltransferase [Elusimicrobiota bacterium]